MMIRTVNRWAIETYLEQMGEAKNRPSFKLAAATLKKNERPQLNFAEDTFLKAVEEAASEYLMLQTLAFRLDDHLISLEVPEDRRGAIVGAAMFDGTKRYLDWERQHNQGSSGKILVVNGATGESRVY